MWDWLKQEQGFSAGAAWPVISIMVFLAGMGLLFGGLLVLKTETAELPFADHRLRFEGDAARYLGLGMCAAGVFAFVSLLLLLF